MIHENLLSVLNHSIRGSGLSRREIERRLGVGQGYLNSIFKGRIQLRVSHVEEIARVLEIEPLSLFLQACSPKDPNQLLRQLGIVPGDPGRPPAGLALVPDLGEINRFVREVVRDEMARISEPKDGA